MNEYEKKLSIYIDNICEKYQLNKDDVEDFIIEIYTEGFNNGINQI